MKAQVRRRTLLRAAASTPAAGLVAGCGGLARTAGLGDFVRVAVSWSGAELAAFTRVLDQYAAGRYEVIPLGDDIGDALSARTTGRPDVVAVPQAGYVTDQRDHLEKLPAGVWRDSYHRIWPDASVGDDHYALPFKLANTSVVWYREDVFARLGLSPPATWADWLDLNDAVAEAGMTPLALGGADGWLLAQFFQNVLLRTFRDRFDELAGEHDERLWQHEDVVTAFEMSAAVWGRSSVGERALVQQFPDAVLEMCAYGRAAMVPAPDFAESVIRRFAADPGGYDTFAFPSRDGVDTPYAVSSDLLVLTSNASDAARQLIRDLARPAAPVPWIRGTGGFIAANPETDMDHYSDTERRLANAVLHHEIRFGLADQLGRLGGSEGLQRVLQDLLRAAVDGVPARRAAEAAGRAMTEAERRMAP